MFRWIGLIGLRMKTIAVVELEYGSRLEVAGGADSPLFNRMTRLARDAGGNEYDAAAVFMVADTVARLQSGTEARIGLIDLLEITNRRMPLMRQPAFVHDVTTKALTTVGT